MRKDLILLINSGIESHYKSRELRMGKKIPLELDENTLKDSKLIEDVRSSSVKLETNRIEFFMHFFLLIKSQTCYKQIIKQ